MTTDEAKIRELIAKRLEEIATQNEKDSSHDAVLPAWIAGVRDAAGFVRGERFQKDEMPGTQPVEIACVLNSVSSNGIVHLECEIKDRPIEEALEIQIRLSELESVYRYLIGGLDDEGGDGNPIIRPMTGFDVWDITRSKEESEELAATNCEKCGHLISLHSALVGCRESVSNGDPRFSTRTCGCKLLPTTAEQSESKKPPYNVECARCGLFNPNGSHCASFESTRDGQFVSCLRSVQPERSSQSQEPQSPDHFPGKYLRDQIAANLAAHMENTLKSNRREALDQEWALSFQTSLALLTSLVAGCPTCYTLVAQALSSLHQTLDYSHPTHRAHLNSVSPTE